MNYALVEKGITTHLGALPKKWKGMSLENTTPEALAKLGWLPLLETFPTKGSDDVSDGHDVVVEADKVTIIYKVRTLSAQEISDRDMSVWVALMAESDIIDMPRFLEDHIQSDHSGVSANSDLMAKFTAKKIKRGQKPS